MRARCIIAEYNPLHCGHEYHLKRAIEQTEGDVTVVVMSGDAVQRGEFSVLPKSVRAAHEVAAGADIVIELPFCYAVNSAERFAEGAIKTLSVFPNAVLSFGSECGDLSLLCDYASLAQTESREFCLEIKELLKQGKSYPRAHSEATAKLYPQFNGITDSPNNLLAVEYIKAARKYFPSLEFHTVKRESDYNDKNLGKGFASATAVRNAFFKGNFYDLKGYLPPYSLADLQKAEFKAAALDALAEFSLTRSADDIRRIYEISEGLENRYLKAAATDGYENILDFVKTKRYTMTKLKRIMLYMITGFTAEIAQKCFDAPLFFNVLAVRESKTEYLSLLAEKAPVTVKSADFSRLPESCAPLAEFTRKAARLRQTVFPYKGKIPKSPIVKGL